MDCTGRPLVNTEIQTCYAIQRIASVTVLCYVFAVAHSFTRHIETVVSNDSKVDFEFDQVHTHTHTHTRTHARTHARTRARARACALSLSLSLSLSLCHSYPYFPLLENVEMRSSRVCAIAPFPCLAPHCSQRCQFTGRWRCVSVGERGGGGGGGGRGACPSTASHPPYAVPAAR